MLNARRHTGLGKAMMSVTLIARISVKQFLCSHEGECSDGNVEKQQQRIHRQGWENLTSIEQGPNHRIHRWPIAGWSESFKRQLRARKECRQSWSAWRWCHRFYFRS